MTAISIPSWQPYCGPAPTPAEWIGRWNGDPVLLCLFVLGAAAFWHMLKPRAALFGAALAILALLFFSPLCALASALFSVRVAHHIVMAGIVAPLLVLSVAGRTGRLPGSVPLWAFVHGFVLWAWHAPAAYAWALSSDAGYWAMEVSIGLAAVGFWWKLRDTAPLAAVGALLFTTMHMGLLGALITFSPRALYAPHDRAPLWWGLTPLEDQQLAGLIMWVPSMILYLGPALILAGRTLRLERAPSAR